jgi:hypothetical protein
MELPRIPKQQIFLTNVCYDFFFKWQTEKKNLFKNNKKFVSFFTAQTQKNSRKKLVKPSDEFVRGTGETTGLGQTPLDFGRIKETPAPLNDFILIFAFPVP